ncbi:LOW QUALITY PROTEIN: hypothetical protein PHMEG_00028268 [Phytophthora megakarya]|uniref:Uncharacterized protein n=1 Tax=Phytophthora megakarya TaxID=4795 RepID=A0A225V4Y2_9STRA|nr:LOW QUALITY PROTEIN: hypothetical protein PHMEG_00028268 [Phytophthora megakarya]
MEPVARSVDSATDGSSVGDDPVSAAVALGASSPTPTESPDVNQYEEKSPDAAVADLEHTFMCVMHVLSTEGNDDPADDDFAVHEANYISLQDYTQELAFLPDLTVPSVTELDYTAPNVKNSSFIGVQQRQLDEVLKKQEAIMISSGNASPPPAYGVLYELLKGLLKAGLICVLEQPMGFAHLTAIMEYAMPLVDDLLTELENYLWFCSLDAASGFGWFCSLDAASGFWAIMMTVRACKMSAFVCALGHFEWLRMPFGFKNAPLIYQRMIDNALWGFVQPKGGWERYAERMKLAEEAAKHQRSLDDDSDFTLTTTRTKFEADRQASSELNPVLRMVNDPYADMFATNEPDESSLVPVFQRIRADPKKMTAITKLPFPKSKKGMQQFIGSLNYYSRFIQDFAAYGAALYQLKEDDFFEGGDLAVAKESFTALQRKVADALILRNFDAKKDVHIMLYANEWALSATLMQLHDDKLHLVRFCGRVLKDAEMNSPSAEKEALGLLLLLKVCYTSLAGKTLHVYTRFSTLRWVHTSKTLFGRAVLFALPLSSWQFEVQRVREKDCAFTQLLQSTISNFVDLDDSLALVAPPTKGSPITRLDLSLLYAQLPHDYEGFVVSFDGSAKPEKNGATLPEWHIVIAASAYLEQTTVNMAEYSGMNHGVIAALEHGAEDLVIVGDSRLAIPQSLGVIACQFANDTPEPPLRTSCEPQTVRYLHVVREYNAAANSLAGEALESKVSKMVLNDHRKTELKELNRIQEMIYEPSSDDSKVENASSETFAQILDGKTRYIHDMNSDILLQRNTFADFAHQERAELGVRSRPRRNIQRDSETQGQRPSTEVRHELTADDIEPVTVQEERRRRIAKAQDEGLRWSNLKTVLRGETTAMSYKEARETWKVGGQLRAVKRQCPVLHGCCQKVDENQPVMSLRLVVPTTMIQ